MSDPVKRVSTARSGQRHNNVALLASAPFSEAVASLRGVTPRPEIVLEELPAPRRIAPYSFALGATVMSGDDELANGRLIFLFDPQGQPSWDGTMRLVSYVGAETDPTLANDPAFAQVGWGWLQEALEAQRARHTALTGTVTQVHSTRFHTPEGADSAPDHTTDIEIRASWTALEEDLAPHLRAWCTVLETSAGLPPPGITTLKPRV
ncbi:MAG: DUF3000 domain-containing protein [Corynebacteriales bacterium]|nr:DUF3000 domain-containing protein [Mycobacteriales bacterium]